MRVTIITYGSRGDVQPCLALAKALQHAGHMPRLALPGYLRTLADELDIPAISLPGDIEKISQGLARAGSNPLQTIRTLKETIEPVALEAAQAAFQACQDADLIVHTFLFTLGAHAFARQLGVPDVSAQFFPMFYESESYPQLAFPQLSLGRWLGPRYNRLTHQIGSALFAVSQRAMYPRVRKAAPELPARLPWPFKASGGRAATPLLLAFSPALIPPESDWGEHVHPTGFWFLDQASNYQPTPELVKFLDAGPPPVCAGLGSMLHPNAAQIQRSLLDGLRQAGQRVVILTGWDGWESAEPGPDRLFIRSAPHDWLFPRCAAIIHHAGSGTSAAALRSGQPNIPLPLAADQFFWARRIHACGTGSQPLEARTLTPIQVANAVRQALESDTIRRKAAALGAAIRSEKGVEKAVEIIERSAAWPAASAPSPTRG